MGRKTAVPFSRYTQLINSENSLTRDHSFHFAAYQRHSTPRRFCDLSLLPLQFTRSCQYTRYFIHFLTNRRALSQISNAWKILLLDLRTISGSRKHSNWSRTNSNTQSANTRIYLLLLALLHAAIRLIYWTSSLFNYNFSYSAHPFGAKLKIFLSFHPYASI